MASIADLFGRLLLDDAGFEKAVVRSTTKASDAATKTMGQRVSAGLKVALGTGLTVAATATTVALGIATKGALELERAVADYQAATGASAEEAKAAGKTINRVAGEERQSLQAVTEVAVRVAKDLGATGPVADKLTKAFTRFARVTKQDAAGAVSDFDDILDAWGLTAEDALGVQDKLLVSNQKWGGSIVANQKALAALAPSLKAANLNIDDGIALLNMFEASGVDSAVAVTGMTKALTKVKSPEELKRLIADIIATEDPFLRAQKASDLFGAKAGAKLANALKPGMGGLEAFGVTALETAGATDKAADVIDSTVSGRIAKAFSVATAQLREFGAGFGPALTGIAALASLGAQLGGGKLAAMILGPIGGLGKKMAIRLAAALGVSFASAAVSGAAEAGGEVVGNMTAKAIQKRLAGKAAGDVMAKGLETGLIGLESSPAIKGATGRLGTFMGSSIGKAVSIAFAAVAVVELVRTFQSVQDAIKQQTADLAAQTAEFVAHAELEELIRARKGTAEQLAAMGNDPIAEALGLSAKKGIQDTLGQLDAEIATRTAAAANSFSAGEKDIGATGAKIETTFFDVGAANSRMASTILAGVENIKRWVHGLASSLATEARAMIDGYYDPLIAQADLQVQKEQVAAAQREVAATKAGSAERKQANLTLLNSQRALDQTRTNLLEAGTLSKAEQKQWLSELQAKYRTATGDAKAKIGALIAKIRELQHASSAPITVKVVTDLGSNRRGYASGGTPPVGVASWVGEHGRELIVPQVPSFVLPHDLSEAVAGSGPPAGASTTINLTTNGLPMRAETPLEIVTQLRRGVRIGVLAPVHSTGWSGG